MSDAERAKEVGRLVLEIIGAEEQHGLAIRRLVDLAEELAAENRRLREENKKSTWKIEEDNQPARAEGATPVPDSVRKKIEEERRAAEARLAHIASEPDLKELTDTGAR